MKFRVERDVLADAAAWVARSLPTRPPVPVLGGVLLERPAGPTGDRLTVSGFDYEISARVELDATIGDPGRALVSGRLLADITRALPPKPVDVAVDGSARHDHLRQRPVQPARRCRSRTTRSCPPCRSSPAPSPAEVFARGRRAGRRGRRPGRHAADAHRHPHRDRRLAAHARRHRPLPARRPRVHLGARRTPTQSSARARSRPGPWRRSAKTLAGAGTRRAGASAGDGLLGLTGGGRRATTRLLDAEFPRYRQLLPTEHTSAAMLEVAPLVEAIKRVSLVTDRGHPGPHGVRRRRAAAHRRRRRRGQRRGGAALRARRRAADHRVQPRLPARRARRAAHRARPAHVHHAQPPGAAAPGAGAAGRSGGADADGDRTAATWTG